MLFKSHKYGGISIRCESVKDIDVITNVMPFISEYDRKLNTLTLKKVRAQDYPQRCITKFHHKDTHGITLNTFSGGRPFWNNPNYMAVSVVVSDDNNVVMQLTPPDKMLTKRDVKRTRKSIFAGDEKIEPIIAQPPAAPSATITNGTITDLKDAINLINSFVQNRKVTLRLEDGLLKAMLVIDIDDI